MAIIILLFVCHHYVVIKLLYYDGYTIITLNLHVAHRREIIFRQDLVLSRIYNVTILYCVVIKTMSTDILVSPYVQEKMHENTDTTDHAALFEKRRWRTDDEKKSTNERDGCR